MFGLMNAPRAQSSKLEPFLPSPVPASLRTLESLTWRGATTYSRTVCRLVGFESNVILDDSLPLRL